jgi:hypothetical protein
MLDFSVKPPSGFVIERGAGLTIRPEEAKAQVADMKLAPEALLEGVVTDQLGMPIKDAEVSHNWIGGYLTTKTDSKGHFALGGCSAAKIQKAQLSVEARGFASYKEHEPKNEIPRAIRLSPCMYLSGRAIDAETAAPVQIDRIVVCEVKRGDDGAPHSFGCGEARFDQPTKGEFLASISTPGEKHVTVMAEGYQRAEEYLLDFGAGQNITLKLRRIDAAVSVAKQRIRGVVKREAISVADAWVSLWVKRKEEESPNAALLRGRMVDGTYRMHAIDTLTNEAGEFLLDVPNPGDYYVVAHALDGPPAISAALHLAAGDEGKCDLMFESAGTIRGRVSGVAPTDAKQFWVVAFGHTPLRVAMPVDRNGEFVLGNLPAGEIGLKIGYEGYWDEDVARYPWKDSDWETPGDPWRRATKVAVRPGETIRGIELSIPPPGLPDKLRED